MIIYRILILVCVFAIKIEGFDLLKSLKRAVQPKFLLDVICINEYHSNGRLCSFDEFSEAFVRNITTMTETGGLITSNRQVNTCFSILDQSLEILLQDNKKQAHQFQDLQLISHLQNSNESNPIFISFQYLMIKLQAISQTTCLNHNLTLIRQKSIINHILLHHLCQIQFYAQDNKKHNTVSQSSDIDFLIYTSDYCLQNQCCQPRSLDEHHENNKKESSGSDYSDSETLASSSDSSENISNFVSQFWQMIQETYLELENFSPIWPYLLLTVSLVFVVSVVFILIYNLIIRQSLKDLHPSIKSTGKSYCCFPHHSQEIKPILKHKTVKFSLDEELMPNKIFTENSPTSRSDLISVNRFDQHMPNVDTGVYNYGSLAIQHLNCPGNAKINSIGNESKRTNCMKYDPVYNQNTHRSDKHGSTRSKNSPLVSVNGSPRAPQSLPRSLNSSNQIYSSNSKILKIDSMPPRLNSNFNVWNLRPRLNDIDGKIYQVATSDIPDNSSVFSSEYVINNGISPQNGRKF